MDPRTKARLARALAASAATLALASAARVAADEARETIRLTYSGPPGCPDRASFEARVLARTTRAVLVESEGPARTFDVVLAASPRPNGTLTVRRDDAVAGTREVHADTCSDVADALALVAALAIDPALPLGAPPASSASPAAPAPPAPSLSSAPSAAVPAQPPPVPPAAPAAVRATPEASTHTSAPPPHTLAVGADLSVATGVTPVALVGVSPSLAWRSGRDAVIAPSVIASFLRASSGTLAVTGGAAAFTWTVGRVDGCVVSWPRGSARLLGCLRVEAGMVDAAGSEIASPQSQHRAWFATGPLARGEWDVFPPLFLSAEAAATLRVNADRFFFAPDQTVYEVPFVGFEASAGLGAHFL